ncbi:MAG: sensor histidine kinase [Burkholderiaceae bacterium]|nr:sensor histidine kinase [Burkholderiaceae bacterium]
MPSTRQFFTSRSALTIAAWIGILGLSLAAISLAYTWSKRVGYAQLNDMSAHQLDLYAAGLESELGKHEYLPGILALDHNVLALLDAPTDAQLGARVNKRLAGLNVRAGSLAIFAMDKSGLVRAASNWFQPDSLVGKDLSGQPYFADAMRNGRAHHFAPNALRGSPEYYFAQPVLRDAALVGVVVVKISLEPIESAWIAASPQSNQEIFLVVDESDTIVIASAPEWKDQKDNGVALMLRAKLKELSQPPGATAMPFNMRFMASLEHGNHAVTWPALNPQAPHTLYATQERFMVRQGWRLITLSNASSVIANARQAGFGTAVLAAFIGLLGMYLAQRRHAIASRLAAREALQRAHDKLELRIEQRTAELHLMNQELLREIGERKRAEQVLRASQDDLLQASKLALLGQISAGITHEINQPLTALRSLSHNTQLLLKRGDLGRIERNLRAIADLTERIGRLTGQLKSFSRKAPLTVAPVALAKAVENTLLLLENRIRTEQIALDVDIDAGVRALCDGNRLEQVLINLCANALDAMLEAPRKILTVRAWGADGRAWIRVEDSGAGIADAVMARLFEPFFSTKLSGQGLGLGLAISADIVREFGGVLRAINVEGGAAFELDLKLTEEDSYV